MFRRTGTVAPLLVCLLAAGCGPDEVLPPDGLAVDQPAADPDRDPTADPGPEQLPPAMTPLLDPLQATVCGATVALQGTAAPGAAVFVVGGATTAGIATDAHPLTGRFCLDVPLLPSAENALEVRAQDPDSGISQPALVTVTQKICDAVPGDPDAVQQPDSTNVAVGGEVKSKDKLKEGNPTLIVDDDQQTWLEVGGSSTWSWEDYNGWVVVKLDKLTEVQKVVVRWRDAAGNGDRYGSKYRVLISSASDPGDPATDNGLWAEVARVDGGDGGVDAFSLATTKPLARYVALLLQQDAKPYWKENLGLPFDGDKYKEYFAIRELEVWNVPRATQAQLPAAPPATCAALGTGGR